MTELYHLDVARTVEKSEPYMRTNKKTGKKIESTRKKKTKEKTELVLVKPSASQREDAEFFYGQQFNKFIQAGYMTRAMLQKKFSDVGGLINNDDDGLAKSLKEYMEAAKVIEFYEGQKDLAPDKKELLDKSKKNFALAQQVLTDFELNINSQFNQTADVKAEHKVLEWLLLESLYIREKNENGESELFPFFEGHDYKEKREFYLNLRDDEDQSDVNLARKQEVLKEAFDELIRALAIWNSSNANTEQEIRDQMKQIFDESD